MADIIDIGIAKSDIDYILQAGTIMITIAIFGGIFAILSRYFASKISAHIGADLRQKVFEKITYLSFHEINQFGASSLITRTTNDITQIQNVLGVALRLAFFAPLMLFSTLFITLSKDFQLTIVIISGTLLLMAFMTIILHFSIPLFKRNQKMIDAINLVVKERLNGVREIRAFNKTQFEEEKFNKKSLELQQISTTANRLLSALMPAVQLTFSVISILLVWYGALRIENGSLQIGELMAFLQYSVQLVLSIVMLLIVFIVIPRAKVSIERVIEILDIENEITDNGTEINSQGRGKIEYRHVSFFYDKPRNKDKKILPTLDDVTTILEPGKYHAIIGSTGSGKSSMIRLLERFYDPTSGEILIDDIDIKKYPNKYLKQIISVSSQKVEILSGTIRSNVDINNCLTDEAVIDALKKAGAYEFVEKLKDGIHHKLNRSGSNLSGGQKQRISIARALAKKSLIYIFDDSFSALDYKTETKVKDALLKALENKTIIVVAQKIQSIQNAHNILVMDQGKLVASGTHQELKKNCKIYQEIINSQKNTEIYE